ncbi:MAG: hypothetical protein KVP17_000982 [Porospora cf. gigantea B]|uniref:uncharacterized protein n=1 Tax=Porospora cf. gigantea B TaxID=2853592 RepID=UPI0035717B58|nr:MAG: hypothetical protein KVP17_000982 [Porospora cf. gigantea B]
MGKLQRKKRNRKFTSFYRSHFGIQEPYRVVVDPEFILYCLEKKLDVKKTIAETLGSEKVTVVTSQCCLAYLRQKKRMGAVVVAKKFFKVKCGHMERAAAKSTADITDIAVETEEGIREIDMSTVAPVKLDYSKAQPPETCIKDVIGVSNQNKYILASGSLLVAKQFKKMTGLPQIAASKGKGLFLKEPSVEARKEAERELATRLEVPAWEKKQLQSQ